MLCLYCRGAGETEVVGYMNKVLSTLGANIVGGIGVAIGRDPEALGKAETEAIEWERRWPVPSGANSPIPNRTRFTGRNGSTSASS